MIAVVGAALELPGAPDVAAFWDLLVEGRSGLTRLTDQQLAAAGVPDAVRHHPGFVPVSGLVPWSEDFAPGAFGFSDGEAGMLDPQHRRFLTCARRALEDAGHAGGCDAGSVGVFAGAAHSTYLASVLGPLWDPSGGGVDPVGSLQAAFGTHGDYLPMHVAHRLDLTGPAVTVQSACATSLVAIHQAVQALLDEECDTALAGGVSLTIPQGRGYVHVPGGLYSADGVVRPFGAEASGMIYSQGVGAVVLRRLEDAQADGDRILAVVHGSAVGNDGGRRASFSAPTVHGQQLAATEALAVADVDPHRIGLVEAHGTGTLLGDAIEVRGLARAYSGGAAVRPWCALGSVKGNVGHTNTAAGVVAFVKAVLAVHHQVQPATLNSDPVNPELQLDATPFDLVHETRDWTGPELAAVNSYGVGGSNVHVVLGPAPQPAPRPEAPTTPQVVLLSAPTASALSATAARLGERLTTADAPRLDDVALTLGRGRFTEPHRLAVVGSDPAQVARALASGTARTAAVRPPVVVTAPADVPAALAALCRLEPAERVRAQLALSLPANDPVAQEATLLVVAVRLLGALGMPVDDIGGGPAARELASSVLGAELGDPGGQHDDALVVVAGPATDDATTGVLDDVAEGVTDAEAVRDGLLRAVAAAWAAGAEVDVEALLTATGATRDAGTRRVALPGTVLDDHRIARPAGSLEPEAGSARRARPASRPAAEAVREAWSELLGVAEPADGDDFFAEGGHSLLALRLVTLVQERSGVQLGALDVVEAATLGELVARAEAAEPEPEAQAPVPGADAAQAGTAVQPQQRPDELPMTRVQHAYWVGRSGGYRHGDVPCYFAYEFASGDLDLERYEAAWRAVVARHPMLRAVVTDEGVLRVVDTPPFRLKVTDLSTACAEEVDFRLDRIRTDVFRRPGPSDRWPLFTVQAVVLPGGERHLLVGMDVLVCDAASWFLIDRELARAYAGEELEVMPVAEVKRVLEALEARRGGRAFEQAAQYWRARYDDIPAAAPVTSRSGGDDERGDGRGSGAAEPDAPNRFVRFAHEIDAALWSRFQERCRAERVTPSSALLAAYAQTLREWTGEDRHTVMLTTFDRPDGGVEDVVGDFTTLALHVAEPGHDSFGDLARATQRRLFADLQHGIFTALDVSGELASRRGTVQEWPVVFTSALGVQADDGHDPDWSGRQVDALTQTPQVMFDHQVLEHDGRLRMQFDVLVPAVEPEVAEAVARHHHERVRDLAGRADAWAQGVQEWAAEVLRDTTPPQDEPSPAAPAVDQGAVVEPSFTPSALTTPGATTPPTTWAATAEATALATAGRSTSTDLAHDELTIVLRDGPAYGGRTLHLFHPSGGDITCYADLANRLPDDVAVVAYSDLYARVRSDGELALPADIRAMATAYAAAVVEQQPHGPYLLGGWSMGGDLAQEVAVQLTASGRRVDLLFMLDSTVPTVIVPLPGTTEDEVRRAAAVRYLGALEAFRVEDLGLGSGHDLLARLGRLGGRPWIDVVEQQLQERGVLSRRESVGPRIDAVVRDLTALGKYFPRPLVSSGTQIRLARARRRAPRNAGIGVGVDDIAASVADLGWGALLPTRPPEVLLEAHHYSVLHEPALSQVEALVRDGLEAATGRPAPTSDEEVRS